MQARGSREQEARDYLEKHRIMELLNYLTSTLLFFRPALFTGAKIWKQPKCLSADGWMMKMCCVYTMEYYSAVRKKEILPCATWTALEDMLKKPREYLISVLERLRIAKMTGLAFPFFMDHSNIVSMFEMMDTSNKGTISFVQYREALKTLGLLTADEVLKDDGHAVTLDKFRREVNKRMEEIWAAF
uniref:EF-hand calcium binding domain 10 n=1 Tax=Felis catus TaxID=9685 RepID=A0ABI7XHY4_FELCA